MPQRITASPVAALKVADAGTPRVPGDKSLSHRALICAALALGESRITGLLEAEDVRATASALELLGADIETHGEGRRSVFGRGIGGWRTPARPLDLENSGTGARLLLGAVAGAEITATFTGDESLSKRPFARVIEPLTAMGAVCTHRDGRLPITITGRNRPLPIVWRLPVPSAQIKSAILFAALSAPGETRIEEPVPCRDHTERILPLFGAEITCEETAAGGRVIRLCGERELVGAEVAVPADPSSAAFLVVAWILRGQGTLTLKGVGVNPLRIGLFETLREMGAKLRFTRAHLTAGDEPTADLEVEPGALKGVRVEGGRAASMIDEYPILAVAAACAVGTTRMEGLSELRHKESDRLGVVAAALVRCGVRTEARGDVLEVEGSGEVEGGATLDAAHDHRVAMSLLVLGGNARKPIVVRGTECIATSYPGFVAAMQSLGAALEVGYDSGDDASDDGCGDSQARVKV